MVQSSDVMPSDAFPWEHVIWRGKPGFLAPADVKRARYTLTDFRLLIIHPARRDADLTFDEMQILEWRRSRVQRALARADLVVRGSLAREPLRLADLSCRACLMVVEQILARNPAVWLEPALEDVFLRRLEPAVPSPAPTLALMPPLVILTMLLIAIGIKGNDFSITYPADDAVMPGGHKRPAAEIVAFMESEVMPFAREALGPIVGGTDRVRCETCHGRDGRARGWKMPGVIALPEPHVRSAGLERRPDKTDAWLRNAIYADLAEDQNQPIARHMRSVVMPGMARLLHRPAYDFTKSYRYNRSRFALGCYHCHRVQ
ncbi:MAG: hypothetical protein HY654_04480 [Acidobacteria bacterium]|nr:hypothetical protein [Acidobacteriota bacterium]